MGAVFAGAARAPITAVVILFELTGEYTIILPLMAAIVLATGISHLLTGDTIYTLKLRRRGVDLDAAPNAAAMNTVTVGQVMEPVNADIAQSATLLDAADLLTHAPHAQLPVLDSARPLPRRVTARRVADALADGDHDDATVATVVDMPAAVTVTDRLEQALECTRNSARRDRGARRRPPQPRRLAHPPTSPARAPPRAPNPSATT